MFGIYRRIRKYGFEISVFLQSSYFKQTRGNNFFVFNNKKYKYFIHPYNNTWKNERIIEIPIIKEVISGFKGKKILEIGNVLAHYGRITHDVLDKYESDKNVINEDVAYFKSPKKYDLIISISTLEHVGWDEEIKDKTKVIKAISTLKKLLKGKGKIVITHPWGYNSSMDLLISTGKIAFQDKFLLIRESEENTWKQIPWKKNLKIKYWSPFPGANCLLVGVIK